MFIMYVKYNILLYSFRFSLIWTQTEICLPKDINKSCMNNQLNSYLTILDYQRLEFQLNII